VTLAIALLGVIVLALDLWACRLAWHGRWKISAIILATPLVLAGIVVLVSMSGPLQAENWGPIMALLAAAAVASFTIVVAAIAALAGYLGHRSRKGTGDNLG
jgi:hypothetical protein